jgi:hypothetical protein
MAEQSSRPERADAEISAGRFAIFIISSLSSLGLSPRLHLLLASRGSHSAALVPSARASGPGSVVVISLSLTHTPHPHPPHHSKTTLTAYLRALPSIKQPRARFSYTPRARHYLTPEYDVPWSKCTLDLWRRASFSLAGRGCPFHSRPSLNPSSNLR